MTSSEIGRKIIELNPEEFTGMQTNSVELNVLFQIKITFEIT